METATATIRELRLNFRGVKRKIEAFGEVLITDNGVPSYVIKSAPQPKITPRKKVDYWARLIKMQPRAMSEEESKALNDENRGDR